MGVLLSSIVGSIAMMPTFVAFSTGNTLLQNGAGYAQVSALITTLTMVGMLTFPRSSSTVDRIGSEISLYLIGNSLTQCVKVVGYIWFRL